jgi:hypothetical protein
MAKLNFDGLKLEVDPDKVIELKRLARISGLEKAAKLICQRCKKNEPVFLRRCFSNTDGPLLWIHSSPDSICRARAIQTEIDKEKEE